MALEESTFKVGGIIFPLTAATTNSLLQDADPTLYYALDYFAGVLQIHLGARWAAEATLAGRADLASSIVAYKIPFDPAPYLTEEQLKFPLLSLFTVREDIQDKTNVFSNTNAVWSLNFLLPPLRGEQAERLMPILRVVPKVILNRLRMGWDPNYNAGQLPWALSKGMAFEILSVSYGSYEGLGNLSFPSTQIELRVSEREADASATDPVEIPGAFDPYTELLVHEDQKNVDGSTYTDIVQIQVP
jgi:hypothetical protein